MITKRRILFFLIPAGAFLIIAGWVLFDRELTLKTSHQEIPANGISSALIQVHYRNPLRDLLCNYSGPFQLKILTGENLVISVSAQRGIRLKAGFIPGQVYYTVRAGETFFNGTLSLTQGKQDSDQDGIPDAAELVSETDRENFLRWFLWIAESQYYRLSPYWQKNLRDCAGLIQFSMKEALKIHDNQWFERFPYLTGHLSDDVRKYTYPNVPLLGTRIFRTRPGEFHPSRIEEEFSESATASVLLNHNVVLVGREISAARQGDLIFFRQEDHPKMPYHAMIYSGESQWLIYHTGPDGESSGQVRKVALKELMRHPDKRWHPAADNPSFLGVYRLKLIN